MREPVESSFIREVNDFIKNIYALEKSFVLNYLSLASMLRLSSIRMKEIASSGRKIEDTDNPERISFEVNSEDGEKFERNLMQLQYLDISIGLLQKNSILGLISQYDYYISRILKMIYINKPELVDSSDRKIAFAELQKFQNMEDARNYVLEKELEGFLRESHVKQFAILESKFDIPLTKLES